MIRSGSESIPAEDSEVNRHFRKTETSKTNTG